MLHIGRTPFDSVLGYEETLCNGREWQRHVDALLRQDEFDEAAALIEKALHESTESGETRQQAIAHNAKASLRLSQANFAEALDLAGDAMVAIAELSAPVSGVAVATLHLLSRIHLAMGECEEALSLARGAPAEGPGGGTPAKGPPPPPGARGGEGGGGWDTLGWGHPQKIIQSPDRLYKAPRRLYKAPKRLYKAPTDYTKT